jgi:hypothetical protein
VFTTAPIIDTITIAGNAVPSDSEPLLSLGYAIIYTRTKFAKREVSAATVTEDCEKQVSPLGLLGVLA